MGEEHILDYTGLRCPLPVMKAAIQIQALPAGTTVLVHADCPDFPTQVRDWCNKSNRALLSLVTQGKKHTATIRS